MIKYVEREWNVRVKISCYFKLTGIISGLIQWEFVWKFSKIMMIVG